MQKFDDCSIRVFTVIRSAIPVQVESNLRFTKCGFLFFVFLQCLFIAYVHDEILRNANHIHIAFNEKKGTVFSQRFLIEWWIVSTYGAFYSLLLDIGTVDIIIVPRNPWSNSLIDHSENDQISGNVCFQKIFPYIYWNYNKYLWGKWHHLPLL